MQLLKVNETMDFEEEFGTPKTRRRRPRIYLLLLLIPIITLFIFLIVSTGADENESISQNKLFSILNSKNDSVTLGDILTGRYYPKTFNGTFYNEKIQYFSPYGDLIHLDVIQGTKEIIIQGNDIKRLISGIAYAAKISPSGKYILFSHDPQRVFRRSMLALYDVYDRETRKVFKIASPETKLLQFAKWSEDEDKIVFVAANDIYLSDLASVVRVTNTGSESVFNGVCDWVYEEEIFTSNEAVWMRNGELVYVTFNDTEVDVMTFPIYAGLQYPRVETIYYPKSGRPNPTATVYKYRPDQSKTKQLIYPSNIPRDNVLGNVILTKDKKTFLTVFNRIQNSSWMLLCDEICETIHTMESTTWLDNDPVTVTDSGDFIIMETIKQQVYRYKHLVKLSRNSVAMVVTNGEHSVQKLHVVSGDNLFYSTNEHLYKQNLTSKICLTCNLNCSFNGISMSTEKYYVNECHHGLSAVPTVDAINVLTGNKINLERNDNLKQIMESSKMPIEKIYSFKSDGFDIKIMLLLPFDFDENKKYPLLIDVYGGPGSYKVNGKYHVDWGTSLVSDHGIIYGYIDGRGSGDSSRDKIDVIYKKLGTLEVEDQIKGVQFLKSKLKFIDKASIWGWSYGGFVSAMATTNDTFVCGMSVAPVTNWMYYDSFYTERYLGLPSENRAGYEFSDLSQHVNQFKNKTFIIAHGNADDNVHFQQSMNFIRQLELHDVLFEIINYPDENHSLLSTRKHLYRTLTRFLYKNSCL